MDSIGEQNNFGVGDVGRIGEDDFYRFPSKLREPWGSVDTETAAPLSYMEYDADKPSGGGGGEVTHALQLVSIDGTTVGVRKGTVNNVIPTIGGNPLDDDVSNNTFTVGAATTFYLKATSTGDIDTDGFTAVAIQTTDPGSDTAEQTKQILGSVGWDGSAIENLNSNLTGSQNVDSCGSFHSWNVI